MGEPKGEWTNDRMWESEPEPPPGFGLIDGREHPDSVVARVNYRRGLEDAARVAGERSQTMPNDDDLTRGYALGRQAAAKAILAMLAPRAVGTPAAGSGT